MSDATGEFLKSSVSKEYFELLRFPTVGAEKTHLRDCAAAATWLKGWLKSIGAEVEVLTRDFAPPVVLATLKGGEGAATILVYGHYDVQPPEPLDKWLTPPFEPTVRDGRVYARGAQDDKGQFFAFLCGLRDYLAASPASAPTFKILLEGQEESGSAALFALLEESAFRKKLAADVMIVADTSAAADLRPAIVAGLRGVIHFTITLKGANRDLHSGEYGGVAPNAAQAMAELLASLHTTTGAIAVEGFTDGIEPPTAEECAAAEKGFVTPEALQADIGIKPIGGVTENAFKPTIEVNGLHTGYGGAGSKTVIPCEALAKLSARLVPEQSPKHAMDAIEAHLRAHTPEGMQLAISEVSGMAAGFRLPLASPLFMLAEEVLTRLDPRGPVYQWDGASIPVVSALRSASGAAPLLVGFGQSEDRIHSPNESFSVRQFDLVRDWARSILAALAG